MLRAAARPMKKALVAAPLLVAAVPPQKAAVLLPLKVVALPQKAKRRPKAAVQLQKAAALRLSKA